jgi:hypothetical protein
MRYAIIKPDGSVRIVPLLKWAVWFETMIFGGPHDSYQERSSTFEEAETTHAAAVTLASEPENRP